MSKVINLPNIISAVIASLLYSNNANSAIYLEAAKGFRGGSYNVSAGWEPIKLDNGTIGGEIAYTDCGDQPDGNNINRMLQFNITGHVKFSPRIHGFAKIGVNNTDTSYNGTNTYDRSGDSLWGYNAGAGLETPLGYNTMLYAQVTVFEYRQVNNPNMGGYTYPSIGLRYVF